MADPTLTNLNGDQTQPNVIPGANPTPTTPTSPSAPRQAPAGHTQPVDGTSAPTGTQQPSLGQKPNMMVFGTVMQQINDRLSKNQDLLGSKTKILNHLYDAPLTPEEMKTLTPSQQAALVSNDRRRIDTELMAINDEVKGRTSTLNNSIKYLTDTYQAEQTRIDQQKKDSETQLLDLHKAADAAGIDFKEYVSSIYGEEVANKLAGMDYGMGSTSSGSLTDAISAQESGGDYSASNPDSGALGKYQIMPKFWFKSIGLDPNSDEDKNTFLNTPALQDQLHTNIINSLSAQYNGDKDKIIAAYYGGDPAAKIVGTPAADKPQGKYPSINDYVNQVKGRMDKVANAGEDFVYGDFKQGLSPQGLKAFENLKGNDKSSISQLVSGDALITDLVKARGQQGSREIERLTKLAKEIDPSFSVNTNKIRYDYKKLWDTDAVKGNVGTKNAINTALGHLADLKQASVSLPQGTVQKMNSVQNVLTKDFGGDQSVTDFRLALTALSAELAKAYKGGVPNEGEIKQWQENLAANFSQKQFDGAFNMTSKLLTSKITALRYGYKSTMGSEYTGTVIDPDKKQALIDAGIDPEVIAKENTGGTGANDLASQVKAKGYDYVAMKKDMSDEEIKKALEL